MKDRIGRILYDFNEEIKLLSEKEEIKIKESTRAMTI